MFGGGIEEGETPEAALFREVREELDYHPRDVIFFRRYEYSDYELNVFLSKVDKKYIQLDRKSTRLNSSH